MGWAQGQQSKEPTERQIAIGLIVVGVLLFVLWFMAGKYAHQIVAFRPQLAKPRAFVRKWAIPAGAVGIALGWLGLKDIAGGGSGGRSKRLNRLTPIVAAGLRVMPESIKIKAKWTAPPQPSQMTPIRKRVWALTKWRKRVPARIEIRHAPGTVNAKKVDELADFVAQSYGADAYLAIWNAPADSIVLTRVEIPAAIGDIPETESGHVPGDPQLQGAASDPLDRARQVSAAHFGPLAEVTAPTVDEAGEPMEIQIRYPATVRASSELLRARVGEEIVRKLHGGQRAWLPSWDLPSDTLTLRRRPPLPKYVLNPALDLSNDRKNGILILRYATDGDGNNVGWNLNASTAHALVVGPTGAGKTVVLRSLATDAPALGCEVWIGDPKRIEMKGLRGWPGITRVCTQIPEIIEMVETVHALMNARYDAIEHNQVLREELTPLVVILDEFLIFVVGANRWWKQTKVAGQTGSTHPVLEMLQEIIVLARSARIHLCLGVQRPDAELFQKGGRDSIRHRVSLGQLSPEGAFMLWQNASTGTDIDMNIRGRATATTSDGTVGEVQAWWTPDPDPHLLQLRPDSLSSDELAALAFLRAAAEEAQIERGEDDLTALHDTYESRARSSSLDAESAANTVPVNVQTARRIQDLEPGLIVLIDIDGEDAECTITEISETDDEDTLTVDYTTDDGPAAIDLDRNDAVFVIGGSPTLADPPSGGKPELSLVK